MSSLRRTIARRMKFSKMNKFGLFGGVVTAVLSPEKTLDSDSWQEKPEVTVNECRDSRFYFRDPLHDEHEEPEDPSITQKNNEALADYCTALLEQNKELKHAVRHCYNAMSEFEDITRELEEYL